MNRSNYLLPPLCRGKRERHEGCPNSLGVRYVSMLRDVQKRGRERHPKVPHLYRSVQRADYFVVIGSSKKRPIPQGPSPELDSVAHPPNYLASFKLFSD